MCLSMCLFLHKAPHQTLGSRGKRMETSGKHYLALFVGLIWDEVINVEWMKVLWM